MNHVAQLDQVATEDSSTLWQYGSRYIPRVNEDGKTVYDIVPLKLEDLLHPHEEDEFVVVPGHSKDCGRLRLGLDRYAPEDRTVIVVEDMNVDLNLPNVKAVRPDVCALEVADVPEDLDNLGTIHLGTHAATPLLVIEVTSTSTRENDLEPKFAYYERANVRQYVIVDRVHPSGVPQLKGFLLDEGEFEEQPLDDHGRIWLHDFGVSLGFDDGEAALFDGGELVPDYHGLGKQRDAAKQLAQAEKQRAEDEKQRAEDEKQRADAEKQRADAAEEKLREFEAEIARMKQSDR